jgi:NAD(P)-dependent dehydrogenase (short-subunit alcohol dehydrogenase family)
VSDELQGRRALVTGGTSGIGLAIARALLDAGAEVVVTGRDPGRAERTAATLGAGATGVAMDVREPAEVRAGVARLGTVDVLVNNAGIGMRTVNVGFLEEPQPFWEVTPEGFADVVATKVNGCFHVAREVVPRMLDAGGGSVITISMSPETMVRRGFVPYGPSGAGVEALAKVMAADLEGTSVRANVLLPGGATATGMIPEGVGEAVRSALLDPAVMGPPAVWLASPASSGVHGEVVVARDWVRPGA